MTLPEFTTTDLGLAVFLAWKGAQEGVPPWKIIQGRDRLLIEFRFVNINSDLISEFRADLSGIQRYNGLRRHYLRIVHTEIGDAK